MAATPRRRPLVACVLAFLLLGQGVAVRPPGDVAVVELGHGGGGRLLEVRGAANQVFDVSVSLNKSSTKGGVCSKIRALIKQIGDLAKEALYTWVETGYDVAIMEQPWLAPAYSGPYSPYFFPIEAVGGGGGGFNRWYEVGLAYSASKTTYSSIRAVIEGTFTGASLAHFVPVVGLVLTALTCVTSFCDLFGKVKLAWQEAVKNKGGDKAIKKRLVCEAVVDGARVLVGLMFTALGIAATVGSFGAAGLAIPIMNVAWDAGSHYAGQMTCDWLARQANGGKKTPGGTSFEEVGQVGEAIIDEDDAEGADVNAC